MTLDDYIRWLKEFDPEKHELVYPENKPCPNQCITIFWPRDLLDGFVRIRPRTPEKKMRKMTYAELRELVVQRVWFLSRDGRWVRPYTMWDHMETVNSMDIDKFHSVYTRYSPTASMQDARTLEVEE